MASTILKATRLSYSHELMLKLRDATPRVKPSLPDLDIVLVDPQISPVKSSDNDNCRPSTDYNTKFQKNLNNDGRRGQRNLNSNDLFKRNNCISIETKLSTIFETPVELHKSETAWKPANKQDSKDETKELLQKMQSLLNKLAPENFDKIICQVKELQMDTMDKLDGCVELLFEKAVSEQHFSTTYAKMVENVSDISVKDPSGKLITFKNLLLQKCQKEFQRDRNDNTMVSDLVEKIKNAKIDEEKKILTEEKEMAVTKSKRRSLGNVKFIGELYKLDMLNERIMVQCLHKLLDESEDEESLECLCKLLSTIGKSLEDKSPSKVECLMTEFDKFKSRKTISTRIKFMMMDVIDLRKAGWISKKNEGPKKISEIHLEAEKEQIEKTEAAQQMPPRQVSKHFNDSYNSKSHNSNISHCTRPTQPRSQEQRYESNRYGSDSRQQRYESNRSDSREQRHESSRYDSIRYGSDSKDQRYENSRSDFKQQRNESNRSYSREHRYESNRYGSREQRCESGRYSSDSRQQRYDNNRSSDSDNWRMGNRSNDKQRESSYQNKRYPSNYERRKHVEGPEINRSIVTIDRSEPIVEEMKKVETTSKVEDAMSRDEMELKVKSRIEEYLSLNDVKEAVETVKELQTDACFKNAVRFFYISLSQNIEKSSKVREQVAILHKEILDRKVAPVKAYTDAWIKFSKFADELIIDIPKVWTYISELTTPVVLESSIFRMNMFAETDSPDSELDDEYIVDDNSKAKLLAAILKGVSKVKGDLQARKIWTASRLKLQDLVKDISVEEFKDKFDLVNIIN